MERVVYLLGAGFSAPLGLPLISNFREKSQDLYLSGDKRYSYFGDVFAEITKLSAIKNFYEANLYNLEEVLSLLEIGDFLEGNPLKESFVRYVQAVILALTPKIAPTINNVNTGAGWTDDLFGASNEHFSDNARKWKYYGYFIGALLGLSFSCALTPNDLPPDSKYSKAQVKFCALPEQQTLYSIVTLNYDLVPEMVSDYCHREYKSSRTHGFGKPVSIASTAFGQNHEPFEFGQPVSLAKLHGCAKEGTIVPPTWSKGANPKIAPAWKIAYKALSTATQLRIIGFSLPAGDAYVKYLIKSASVNNPYLKRVDVICLDPDGSVYKRYAEFITTRNFRFVNRSVMDYLMSHHYRYSQQFWHAYNEKSLPLAYLEEAHKAFMEQWRHDRMEFPNAIDEITEIFPVLPDIL